MNSFFDFSFTKFITPKIIGIIYFIAFVVAGLVSLGVIASSFGQGFGTGIVALLLTPLVAILYLLAIRMGLESIVASIKTAENTTAIKEYLLSRSGSDRI